MKESHDRMITMKVSPEQSVITSLDKTVMKVSQRPIMRHSATA